jgi:hypothetical protein
MHLPSPGNALPPIPHTGEERQQATEKLRFLSGAGDSPAYPPLSILNMCMEYVHIERHTISPGTGATTGDALGLARRGALAARLRRRDRARRPCRARQAPPPRRRDRAAGAVAAVADDRDLRCHPLRADVPQRGARSSRRHITRPRRSAGAAAHAGRLRATVEVAAGGMLLPAADRTRVGQEVKAMLRARAAALSSYVALHVITAPEAQTLSARFDAQIAQVATSCSCRPRSTRGSHAEREAVLAVCRAHLVCRCIRAGSDHRPHHLGRRSRPASIAARHTRECRRSRGRDSVKPTPRATRWGRTGAGAVPVVGRGARPRSPRTHRCSVCGYLRPRGSRDNTRCVCRPSNAACDSCD